MQGQLILRHAHSSLHPVSEYSRLGLPFPLIKTQGNLQKSGQLQQEGMGIT
jgi:hypothetical protein